MQTQQKIRIYADGVFDMFHYGHAQMLKQCKDMFEGQDVELIVGVSSDADTYKYKGKTILNEKERALSIQYCKFVDEVICPCPWEINLEFLEKNNIDYVCHDDLPYTSNDCDDIYKPIKEAGKFKATQRTDGISTSDILNRIIVKKNEYIQRNIQKGYSLDEMNLNLGDKFIIKLNQILEEFNCQRRV